MSKLEKAYLKLQEMEISGNESDNSIDPIFSLAVTIIYLIVMLSVPIGRLSMLIWFALIPILLCSIGGLSYGKVFLRSLYILPFLALIGCFNPMIEREQAFTLGHISINKGWISFFSIIVRGLLALQVILILIETNGFIGICRALRKLGVPSFLTDQLLFIFRYISILIREAISMRRARESRGYGRKNYPVKIWGVMIGQLFIRSIERAERINMAMMARGFTGNLPVFRSAKKKNRAKDWCFFLFFTTAIIFLRFYNLSILFRI